MANVILQQVLPALNYFSLCAVCNSSSSKNVRRLLRYISLEERESSNGRSKGAEGTQKNTLKQTRGDGGLIEVSILTLFFFPTSNFYILYILLHYFFFLLPLSFNVPSRLYKTTLGDYIVLLEWTQVKERHAKKQKRKKQPHKNSGSSFFFFCC